MIIFEFFFVFYIVMALITAYLSRGILTYDLRGVSKANKVIAWVIGSFTWPIPFYLLIKEMTEGDD